MRKAAPKPRRPARGGRTRPARGRRSREEAARTRVKILDRAERLFARKGYRALSTRELARACGVHPYTIQHHFGAKAKLYEAVLCRWDDEIRALSARHAEGSGITQTIADTIDELLDYLLLRSDWVLLNIRGSLGEGLPPGVASADPAWIRFIDQTLPRMTDAPRDVDSRLLLITIEGILHQHIASQRRYRALFGRDLADPALRQSVKRHLIAVLDAIVRAASK
jgi:AcrR family transcriptional regulator